MLSRLSGVAFSELVATLSLTATNQDQHSDIVV